MLHGSRLLVAMLICSPNAVGQVSQHPSPMVEHTRAHPRLERTEPEGRRIELRRGTLLIPAELTDREKLPLLIHFHGGTWLPEVAASKHGRSAVVSAQYGSGSAAYAREFADDESFAQLLAEAEEKAGIRFHPAGLSGWSAGNGAIRRILTVKKNYDRVRFVLLIDGLHAGYTSGKPGPRESELEASDLGIFLDFAKDAVAGRKQLIITHSEIFPGTYASTTETADYLLGRLHLKRTAVLKWGPMGTQQLSEVSAGKFLLKGYAGNSAPDHVDQLHSLGEYLKWIEFGRE